MIPLIFAAQLGNVGVSFAEPRLSHMTALLQMSLVTGECRLADLTVAVGGHWRSNLHLFALGRLEVSTELTCLESPLLKFLLLELTIHLIVLLKSSHRYLVSGQHESWGEVLSICEEVRHDGIQKAAQTESKNNYHAGALKSAVTDV